MKKLSIIAYLLFCLSLSALVNGQIYTPGGIIQGSSGNNRVGLGLRTGKTPISDLEIRNVDNTYKHSYFALNCDGNTPTLIFNKRLYPMLRKTKNEKLDRIIIFFEKLFKPFNPFR